MVFVGPSPNGMPPSVKLPIDKLSAQQWLDRWSGDHRWTVLSVTDTSPLEGVFRFRWQPVDQRLPESRLSEGEIVAELSLSSRNGGRYEGDLHRVQAVCDKIGRTVMSVSDRPSVSLRIDDPRLLPQIQRVQNGRKEKTTSVVVCLVSTTPNRS